MSWMNSEYQITEDFREWDYNYKWLQKWLQCHF